MEHHPDRHGDPVKMKEVQLAYEVLSDAKRRQKYDATGEIDDRPQGSGDPLFDAAFRLIREKFGEVMSALLLMDGFWGQRDILGDIRILVQKEEVQFKENIRTLQRADVKLKSLLGKFKKKTEGDNLFEENLHSEIAHGQELIKHLQESLPAIKKALELMADYSFVLDNANQSAFRRIPTGILWSSTSTGGF